MSSLGSFLFLVVLLIGRVHRVHSQFIKTEGFSNAVVGSFSGVDQVPSSYLGIWSTDTLSWARSQWLHSFGLSNSFSPGFDSFSRYAPYDATSFVAYSRSSSPSSNSGSGVYRYEVTPNGQVSMLGYPAGNFGGSPSVDVLTWASDNKLYALGSFSRVGSLQTNSLVAWDGSAWTAPMNWGGAGVSYPGSIQGFKYFSSLDGSLGFGAEVYLAWTTSEIFYWTGTVWQSSRNFLGGIIDVYVFGGKISVLGNDLRDSVTPTPRQCHLMMKASGSVNTWDCHDTLNGNLPGTIASGVQTSATTFYASTAFNSTYLGNVFQVTFDATTPAQNPTIAPVASDPGTFRAGASTVENPTLHWIDTDLYATGPFDSFLHLAEYLYDTPETRDARWYTPLNGFAKLDSGLKDWVPISGGTPGTIANIWPMKENSTAFLVQHNVATATSSVYNTLASKIAVLGHVNSIDQRRWASVGPGIPPYNPGGFVQSPKANAAYCVQFVGKPDGIEKESIVVAGDFDRIGTKKVNSIGAVSADGTVTALGNGLVQTGVYTDSSGNKFSRTRPGVVQLIEYSKGYLLWAYGDFSQSGGENPVVLSNVGYFNFGKKTWHACAGGLMGPTSMVNAILADGETLYVAGNFFIVGQIRTNSLAKYEIGSDVWTPLSAGPSNAREVTSLVKYKGDLLVGGLFTTSNAASEYRGIAHWTGSRFNKIGVTRRLESCSNSAGCFGPTTTLEMYPYKRWLVVRTNGGGLEIYDGVGFFNLPGQFASPTSKQTKLLTQVDGKLTFAPSSDFTFQSKFLQGTLRNPAREANIDDRGDTPNFGMNGDPVWFAHSHKVTPALLLPLILALALFTLL